MKPQFAYISSTVHFIFPLDYFHSTTIFLCDFSAWVTSSNLPLLFPNWETGRHTSWRKVVGSGFAPQLVSAFSQVRRCQPRGVCFVSEKLFVQGGTVSAALLCFWWPAVRLCEGFSVSASDFKLTCLISGWSRKDAPTANCDFIWRNWKKQQHVLYPRSH